MKTGSRKAGHLCPRLLKEELIQFRRLKGYLPRVVIVHIGNPYEQEIGKEIAQVAQELEADVSPGYEDMKITLRSLLAALPLFSSGGESLQFVSSSWRHSSVLL